MAQHEVTVVAEQWQNENQRFARRTTLSTVESTLRPVTYVTLNTTLCNYIFYTGLFTNKQCLLGYY